MMNKAKLLVATFLFSGIVGVATAQPPAEIEDGNKREKVESLKRAYLTDHLELSVKEAEKFWPIYNATEKQKAELRKVMREKQQALANAAKSEKDAIAAMEAIAQKKKEEAELELKLFKEVVPVLGVEKAVRLAESERQFQKEMMKALKDKGPKGPKGDKGPKGPKNPPSGPSSPPSPPSPPKK
jgi:Spy/CpxP family protein refolding chaperone